jgi:hypothetical protein
MNIKIEKNKNTLDFSFSINFTKLINDSKNPEILEYDIKNIVDKKINHFKEIIKSEILKELFPI